MNLAKDISPSRMNLAKVRQKQDKNRDRTGQTVITQMYFSFRYSPPIGRLTKRVIPASEDTVYTLELNLTSINVLVL